MGRVNVELAVEFYQISCGQCGGVYCITEKYRDNKEKHSDGWHCPYCQSSWGYFGDSSYKAKLAAEAERHQATLARLNEAQREIEAGRKKAALLRKRASAGSCPCCTRNFVNLARHMKTKHPDYAKE